MMDSRVDKVYCHYEESLKKFLVVSIGDALLQKLKSRFEITRRRSDLITSPKLLLTFLEKTGELNAFSIEPLVVIYEALPQGSIKNDLNNFIQTHRNLIKKCDNPVIPACNKYAEEIFKLRRDIDVKKSKYAGIKDPYEGDNPCKKPKKGISGIQIGEQVNHPSSNKSETEKNDDLIDEYSEVIDKVSSEIIRDWKQFARYLGLKDSEVEEIDCDPNLQRSAKERTRKALITILKRTKPDSAKKVIVDALGKLKKNNIKKIVEKMI